MRPCYWCGQPTSYTVNTATGQAEDWGEHEAVFGVPGTPCCTACFRKHAIARAEAATVRYVRDARLADAEQLDIGC